MLIASLLYIFLFLSTLIFSLMSIRAVVMNLPVFPWILGLLATGSLYMLLESIEELFF